MFSLKNFTPQQLAWILAIILALPIATAFGLVFTSFWYGCLFFVVLLLFIFSVVQYFIEIYIQRKIKLIYKLIYQTKATKREETYYKYILPKKTIDEVNKEVETWATNYAQELAQRVQNEQYRKEFLQNLSHEFKTPIFSIQGYVEALIDEEDIDEATQKRFLKNAQKNIQRLVHLVNDVDEISTLELGKKELHKKRFIINDLIKEVIDTLSFKAKDANVTTSIKKGTEINIEVFADEDKIRQVLINLVENAIKYSKQNGQIVVSMYKTDNHFVLIEVTDDGIGIEDEHLNRIFERFYRTDKGRSRNVGGTGLGLAICKHIIEAHQQTIHVRSAINVGTTIGFSLPQKA
ncbi:MAG: sensor histidine kinase [Chitinophagaceae bacterium]|jgi:two-component system phosphate regulon sensor histidine kinase PhoR